MKLLKKQKDTKGSMDLYPIENLFWLFGFFIFSSLGIHAIYGKVGEQNKLKELSNKIQLIKLNEELLNFHTNTQDFSYAESKSYSIYSPEQFAFECFKNDELENNKWEEIKVIFKQSTLPNDMVNKDVNIIKLKHDAFKDLNCNNITYKDETLIYNNKPIYFLTSKHQSDFFDPSKKK